MLFNILIYDTSNRLHSSGHETRYNSSFSKQQESRQKNWEKVNLYLFKTTYWVSKIKLCWLFFQIKRVDQKNSDSVEVSKFLLWYGIVVGNFLSTYQNEFYVSFWLMIRENKLHFISMWIIFLMKPKFGYPVKFPKECSKVLKRKIFKNINKTKAKHVSNSFITRPI